ncbi:MAG: potassium channel family protein, partial [Thalassotalea sp.]|nr:potassium channel family protein [Thalassotalea sp.]
KHSEREGIFTLSGRFIQKELTMRRYQMPKRSLARCMSKVVDLFCGYGEEPLRVVNFSIILILICSLLYLFTGIQFEGNVYSYSSSQSFGDNLMLFLHCIYYSVVTFTTLGYGDITPVGISRAIAATEAFTGSFTIALFVVVFVKKMTR